MARKPPEPLPPGPSRPRIPKYPGIYVIWWDDGTWEWQKCVVCGQPLTSPASRARGYGPSCALVVTEVTTEAVLAEERRNAEAYLEEERNPHRVRRPRPKRAPIDTSGPLTVRLPPAPRSIDPGQRRGSTQRAKPKGIGNAQAKELARLQRAAGKSYSGSGMSEREAALEIARLKRDAGQ